MDFAYVATVCSRFLLFSVAACAVLWASVLPLQAQDVDSLRQRADRHLHAGEYDDARPLYRTVLERAPGDPAAVGYAATFEAVGDYAAGLAAINARLEAASDSTALLHAQGRLYQALGRYGDAVQALNAAVMSGQDEWMAMIELADVLARSGRDREARILYGALYRRYKEGRFRTAEHLTVGGRAAIGVAEFRDANEAFRTAHQVDPSYGPALYAWAELFRQKFNDADARRTFEDALAVNARHAPSLVGLAQATPDLERQEALAQQALAINPNLTAALDLLASLRVIDGLYAEAEALTRRALDVNPNAIPTLAQRASIHHLRGDTAAFRATEQQALAVDPRASDFYLAVVENLTRRFRYPDALTFAERAVQTDPRDPQARAELGTALLRLSRREDARYHLEEAFEQDPYNLFASNALTLLDAYDNFSTLESDHFRLLIHDDERDVLGPLILEVAEASYDSLRTRYPYAPDDKIRLEAYNNPDDFAVRVAGVPHRGLLGVCFGDVLAINTPRALTGRDYNWARTLWHEIAHTMAIGVSQFHVPRWFTEGLSVYEEQRARPAWDREMELAFLTALDRDQLLPLAEIDRGFTRPSFPGQVMLSYYHASRVVRYIADTYGFDAIVQILQQLGTGATQEAAIRAATGVGVEALDRQFRAAVRQERQAVARALEGLPDVLESEDATVTSESIADAQGPFFSQLRAGHDALDQENYAAAASAFSDAMAMYPDYVGPRNAYEGLAAVHRARNETDALIDVLTRYLDRAEHEVDAALELAELHDARGTTEAAIAMWERTLHVAPYEADVRERLAAAHVAAGQFADAVPHRRAVLALEPADRAGAYYRLAQSLYRSDQLAEAKRAVLQSLESAPDFRDAQRLLLDVVDRAGPSPQDP
jgi:tetratricopeptide (TPR) repeat protein